MLNGSISPFTIDLCKYIMYNITEINHIILWKMVQRKSGEIFINIKKAGALLALLCMLAMTTFSGCSSLKAPSKRQVMSGQKVVLHNADVM